jgi:tape measure domain-containing protein
MTNERLKASDVSEAEVFKLIKDDADKAILKITALNAELNKTGTAFLEATKGKTGATLAEINALIEAEKKLNAIKNQAVKNDQNKAKIQSEIKAYEDLVKEIQRKEQASEKLANTEEKNHAQREKQYNKEIQRKEQASEKLAKTEEKNHAQREKQYNKEKERSIKATEKQVKAENDLKNAYKQLSKNTAELKNESKRLGAEMLNLEKLGQKNSEEYRKLAAQYKATTLAAQQGDAQLKKLDATVGDNQRKVGSYTDALNKLRFGLGQLGLALGGAQILNFFTGNEIQLQRMQLALKNVMGTTDAYNKSFSFLTQLSTDYGQDLIVLTDTYKSFIAASESSNLSIDERNKIYQSVIKSGSSLALSNEQIQGSLLAISQMFSKGTVSAEELRGQLGERLPGAFGIMAKSMNVSEQELGKLMRDGKVMAKDVLPKFAEELEKTFGANASKNLQTIGGSWNVLKTKLALYINEGNNANGVTSKIASGLAFLAKNLDSVITIVGKSIKWFLIYKTSMIAINTINKASELGFKEIGNAILRNIPFTKQYTLAQQQASLASRQLEQDVATSGKAINAVPWALIATAVFELAMALWDVASGARQARENMERLFATEDDATKSLDKNINEILERQRKRNNEIQNQLTAKNITQEQFIKLQKQSSELTIKELRTNKNQVIERKNAYIQDYLYLKSLKKQADGSDKKTQKLITETKKIADKYRVEGDESWVTWFTGEKDNVSAIDLISQLDANIQGANIKIKGYTTAILENKTAIEANKAELKGLSKEEKEKPERIREINTEFKRQNDYISEQIKLHNELQGLANQDASDKMAQQIEDNFRNLLKTVNETGELQVDELESIIQQKTNLDKSHIDARTTAEINSMEFVYDQEMKIRRATLDAKYRDLLAQENLTAEARAEIEKNYNKALLELDAEELSRYNDLQSKIVIVKKKSESEKKDIDTKANEDAKAKNDELIQAQIDLFKNKYVLRKKDLEDEKKLAEDRKKIAKLLRDQLNQYGDQLIQWEIDRSKRKQEILNKELTQAKTNEENLRQLAINGNASAKESLAVAEQTSNAKQLAIEKEAKKQQALETIKIAYKAVFDFMEKGDSLPIATVKGATGTAVMKQLFNSLFGFRKGTKRTVGEEFGRPFQSGEDGYLARVDAREKILNPELSAITGDATTDEIVNGFIQFKRNQGGMIVPISKTVQESKPDILAQKIDNLTNVIKNKREVTFSEDVKLGISRGLIETEKKGLTRTRTTYKP